MRRIMRFISPLIHGFLDVIVVLAFLAAPGVLDFNGAPRIACYTLAAVHLALTLLTAFPMGLLKVIPFTIHGAIEATVAPLLLIAPWVLGFGDVPRPRAFFIVSGLAIGAVWLTTNYRAAPTPGQLRRAHLT